jgi:hypothetical protein
VAAPLDPATRVVASTEQVSADMGGEVVILNFRDEVYYGLDEVGAFVWRLLATPRTVAELCDAVTAEFDVDAATCAADLAVLLDGLATRALVTLAPPEAG